MGLGLALAGGLGLGWPGGLKFTFENQGLIFKSKFRSLACLVSWALLPGPGLGWASPAFAAGLCWQGSVGWGLALAGGPGLGWPGGLKFTFENQGLIFKSKFRSLACLVAWALLPGPGLRWATRPLPPASAGKVPWAWASSGMAG